MAIEDNILVSIICNTFNQEDYIRDALDSFLEQITDFKYEILVHDDASTDQTPEIIREYQFKYPNIIKPIFQRINQYSQNKSIDLFYQIPRAQGKYIAYCEGDDYWTDSFKLQKQINILEQYSEIDICTHASIEVEADTKCLKRKIRPSRKNKIFKVQDVIAGGGGMVATNSIMIRKSCMDNEYNFRKFLNLDYTMQIHGALRGGMFYLDECMSAYRSMAKGSWSVKMQNNSSKMIEHKQKVQQMLEILDQETNYQYHDIIKHKIDFLSYTMMVLKGEKKKARKTYKKIYFEQQLFLLRRVIEKYLIKV